MPTPRLDRPAAYEGSEPPEKQRSKAVLPVVLIVLLLVAAAVALGVLLLGRDDEEPTSGTGDDPATTSSEPTTPTTPTTEPTEPTTPPTTAADTFVVVPGDYVGRDRFEVEAELQREGLIVRFVEEANPGDQTEDTVSSLNPTGELTEGDSIDVHYWGPAPVTTPTTETTTPTTPTTTDTGATDATEGGDE